METKEIGGLKLRMEGKPDTLVVAIAFWKCGGSGVRDIETINNVNLG